MSVNSRRRRRTPCEQIICLSCLSRVLAIEAIEATHLPAITPGPCTRAAAGRRPLTAVVRLVETGEAGVISLASTPPSSLRPPRDRRVGTAHMPGARCTYVSVERPPAHSRHLAIFTRACRPRRMHAGFSLKAGHESARRHRPNAQAPWVTSTFARRYATSTRTGRCPFVRGWSAAASGARRVPLFWSRRFA